MRGTIYLLGASSAVATDSPVWSRPTRSWNEIDHSDSELEATSRPETGSAGYYPVSPPLLPAFFVRSSRRCSKGTRAGSLSASLAAVQTSEHVRLSPRRLLPSATKQSSVTFLCVTHRCEHRSILSIDETREYPGISYK